MNKNDKNLKVEVIASTKFEHVITKEDADRLCGLMAGVCYLPDDIETLLNEPEERTQNRLKQIKTSGHTSPFEHVMITFNLTRIPKIIAMYLNNEKQYTTSEKSARYRQMKPSKEEKDLYEKWLGIFKNEITKTCKDKCPQYFTDSKIEKLAQENARYLTSVFTPTTMVYTVPYRQLNILYSLFKKESRFLENKTDTFSKKLKVSIDELLEQFDKTGYIDETLFDKKNRSLSLIDYQIDRPIVKQYGDVYKVAYLGTFAQLAQAHRHRTLHYSMRLPEKQNFFVPPIIKSKDDLVKLWLDDMNSVAENFPQGMLVEIVEQGDLKDLILKAKERKCTFAQLEIDNQTTATINEIFDELVKTNHPAAEEIKPYTVTSSRCTFPDYTCLSSCGYPDGIKGERII